MGAEAYRRAGEGPGVPRRAASARGQGGRISGAPDPTEPGARSFRDHFSTVAEGYQRFRPRYPDALYAYLAERIHRDALVWEVGAGSGQATVGLAGVFRRVLATDGSPHQLRALDVPGVSRAACLAERSPLPDGSVRLVAVAQALHWLDFEAFFAEVRRVAGPEGLLAVWTYRFPELDGALDELLRDFAHGRLGPFWPEDRAHVEAAYATIHFPFPERPSASFEASKDLDVDAFLGYVSTWSALGRARKLLPHDPLESFAERWRRSWGAEPLRTVRWPITLRLFDVG